MRASTADQAIALYTRWTGYNPVTGQPDDGTDLTKAMTDWGGERAECRSTGRRTPSSGRG